MKVIAGLCTLITFSANGGIMELDPAQISDQTILKGRAIISAARGPQLGSPTWLLRQKSDGIYKNTRRRLLQIEKLASGVFVCGCATLDSSCLKIWLRLHYAPPIFLSNRYRQILKWRELLGSSRPVVSRTIDRPNSLRTASVQCNLPKVAVKVLLAFYQKTNFLQIKWRELFLSSRPVG
jgi:hypothetical protein